MHFRATDVYFCYERSTRPKIYGPGVYIRNKRADAGSIVTKIASKSSAIRLALTIQLGLSNQGQGKLKGCAGPSVRAAPDASPVRFDDRPADRQSGAYAFRLSRKEGLE